MFRHTIQSEMHVFFCNQFFKGEKFVFINLVGYSFVKANSFEWFLFSFFIYGVLFFVNARVNRLLQLCYKQVTINT